MAGLNNFEVIGNLGRDPELKHTQNDKTLASFSVAVESGWGDRKETLWIDVTVWGRLAEVAQEYLSKGSKVYLSGEAGLNVFERKNGDPGASITLNANKLVMVGGNGGNGNGKGEDEREPVGAGRGRGRSSRTNDVEETMPF